MSHLQIKVNQFHQIVFLYHLDETGYTLREWKAETGNGKEGNRKSEAGGYI